MMWSTSLNKFDCLNAAVVSHLFSPWILCRDRLVKAMWHTTCQPTSSFTFLRSSLTFWTLVSQVLFRPEAKVALRKHFCNQLSSPHIFVLQDDDNAQPLHQRLHRCQPPLCSTMCRPHGQQRIRRATTEWQLRPRARSQIHKNQRMSACDHTSPRQTRNSLISNPHCMSLTGVGYQLSVH